MERFPGQRVKFEQRAVQPRDTNEFLRLLSSTRQALDNARGKQQLHNADDVGAYRAVIDELEQRLLTEGDAADEERRNAIATLCTIERITLRRRLQKLIGRDERYPDEVQEEADWQRRVIQYLANNENNVDAREQFWRQYDLLFGNDEHVEGNIFRVGIAGQYAAMKFLRDTVGGKVYFATPLEDVSRAIDCYAVAPKPEASGAELVFPIQVKTIQIERQRMIQELNALVEVIPPQEFGFASGPDVAPERSKFLRSCDSVAGTLRQSAQEYGEQPPTVYGLYLKIPYKVEKMPGYMTQVLQLQRGELEAHMVEFLATQLRERLEKFHQASAFPKLAVNVQSTPTRIQKRSSRR